MTTTMEQFDKTFTYDLDAKQRILVHGLINSEEYFKAIATKNSIEIMNCLSNMKSKYENAIAKMKESSDKLQIDSLTDSIKIYNKCYELGLYISCAMIDDEEIFEQIYLPTIHPFFDRKKQVIKQVMDMLQYLKKWNLTNVIIGHLEYESNIYFDEHFPLYKDIKLKEQSFQLVLLLQNFQHLKRKYKLKGGEL